MAPCPKWKFDDATFERSATAFGNPDHVQIMIHNYRCVLAEGERRYDDFERRLALAPVISVPTITLESDANGAPHPDPSAYTKRFQASTRTERSRAASGTTYHKKRRKLLARPS